MVRKFSNQNNLILLVNVREHKKCPILNLTKYFQLKPFCFVFKSKSFKVTTQDIPVSCLE